MAEDISCALEVNEGGKFGDSNDRKRFKRRVLTALTSILHAFVVPIRRSPYRWHGDVIATLAHMTNNWLTKAETHSQHLINKSFAAMKIRDAA